MSWEIDSQYKTKCPCGNGEIIQDVKSDDWGRVNSSKPIIKCDECCHKYKVIEIHNQSYRKWEGTNNEYHLVRIDFHEVEEPILGFSFNINEYKNFDVYITLVKLYKKQELEKVLNEISNVRSCKEIPNDYISYRIIKDLRKIYGTAKIKQIYQNIVISLENYNCIKDNKDEVDRQIEIKRSEYLKFFEHIRTLGIKIDFSK